MLWYGYIYYLLFLFFIFLTLLFLSRLVFLNTFYRTNLSSFVLQHVISFFTFFSFVALVTIYNLLDFYSYLSVNILMDPLVVGYFDTMPIEHSFHSFLLTLHLLSIYSFPFIYIFVLITIISLLFCLSYNISEVMGFSFYATLILVAGYVLFFTDSLILFFLSYELLLVPSFFILYNFAKTRRCVEAAYLMFFWTQFGAMFLIFSFLYLFFICGTSTFSGLSFITFSPFELNFLFLC